MPKTESAFNRAMGQYGAAAVRGAKNNPEVLKYFADAGHPEIKSDETPWCAAFLNAMLEREGLPTTGSLAAQSFLKWGEHTDEPMLGDIVVFWRGSIDSGLGHVGFVTAVYPGKVWVLGGNQNNQVEIAMFSTDNVLDYRRLA